MTDTTFEVVQFPTSGDTVIMCDKWFASAIKRALDTSAAQTEINETYNYVSDMHETMLNQLDKVRDLGPADDLPTEFREELDRA